MGERKQAGHPPGVPVYTGTAQERDVVVAAFDYDHDTFERVDGLQPEEWRRFRETAERTWIAVDGLHRPDVIEAVGLAFGLHPLVIEDIVNVHHRPKIEDYGDYLFCVLKLVEFDAARAELRTEQVSLVLGAGWVLTFAESHGALYAPVVDALRQARGVLRTAGPDYLAYRLVDLVVDHSFAAMEGIGEVVGGLEDQIMASPEDHVLQRVHQVKRALMNFRRALWPMREAVNELLRGTSPLVSDATRVCYRDVYDHVVEAMEMLEMDMGTAAGLHDLYLNRLSQRMNEVMKTLTVIATVILPMGLIPAIYGQNLKIPESEWRLGYPFSLGLTALVALSMMAYLRRRKLV